MLMHDVIFLLTVSPHRGLCRDKTSSETTPPLGAISPMSPSPSLVGSFLEGSPSFSLSYPHSHLGLCVSGTQPKTPTKG